MSPDSVVKLYYRKETGEWDVKKFIKSYLVFVTDIEDINLELATPNTATPVSVEVG